MSAHIDQHHVQDFVNITCTDETVALQYLKATNNSYQRAVELYFGGGLESSYNPAPASGYDEAAFSQDRYGGSIQEGHIPAFQIDSVDDNGPGYTQSTAPTRPPSRVSHRSNDSAMHMGPSSSGVSTVDAIGQESGVLGGNVAPYFGPPTKQHYDTNKWALTLAGPTVSETIPDVEILMRKREEEEPAFLKPLSSGDYLPALLTILATIPMVRNALLMIPAVDDNYGWDANWWCGASIQNDAAIVVEDDTDLKAAADLIRETQRLVAFLDSTDRSYGAVDALTRLDAVANAVVEHVRSDSLMNKFLVAWESAASLIMPSEAIPFLLHSRLLASDTDTQVRCIDLKTLDDFTGTKPPNLYDILDEVVFGGDEAEPESVLPVIDWPAETLVLKVEEVLPNSKGVQVELSEEIYLDRYLESSLDLTAPMRREMVSHKEYAHQIEQELERTQSYSHRKSGKTHNPLDLLATAMQAFRKPTDLEMEVQNDQAESAENPEHLRIAANSHLAMFEELQKHHDQIESRLEDLKAQRNKAAEVLKEVSSLLKEPSEDASRSPSALYRLRGVSTQPTVIYVLYETPDPHQAPNVPASQWWRLEYSHVNSPTSVIHKAKVAFDRVQDAVKEECRTALLVYASKKSTEIDLLPLPAPLHDFVVQDNTLFEEERATVPAIGGWDDSVQGLRSDSEWGDAPARAAQEVVPAPNWGGTYNIGSLKQASKTNNEQSLSDTEMTEEMAIKSRSSVFMDNLKTKMGGPGDNPEAVRAQYIENADAKRQRMSIDSS